MELRRQVDTWLRSQQVRAYIDALTEAAKEHVARELDGRLARWIRWAEEYVGEASPLSQDDGHLLARLGGDGGGCDRGHGVGARVQPIWIESGYISRDRDRLSSQPRSCKPCKYEG